MPGRDSVKVGARSVLGPSPSSAPLGSPANSAGSRSQHREGPELSDEFP